MIPPIWQAVPVEEVVDLAVSLDAFPATAARIREVADDPGASFLDLERAVSADPAVSALVLKIANSAFFGLSRTVANPRDALLVLGFTATRDLAVSVAMVTGLRAGPLRRRLWNRALGAAAAARLLARRLKTRELGDPFVAGLLHELGMLVCSAALGPRYDDLARTPFPNEAAFAAAERERFGWEHPEVGGACLARWEFPEPLVHAVRWWRAVELDPESVPEAAWLGAGLVSLAVRIHRAGGRVEPRALAIELASDPAGHRVGLGSAAIEQVILDLDAELASLASLR